jgi:hypothetical protein
VIAGGRAFARSGPGAGLMMAAGVIEGVVGVDAEKRQLEDLAAELSAVRPTQ